MLGFAIYTLCDLEQAISHLWFRPFHGLCFTIKQRDKIIFKFPPGSKKFCFRNCFRGTTTKKKIYVVDIYNGCHLNHFGELFKNTDLLLSCSNHLQTQPWKVLQVNNVHQINLGINQLPQGGA